MVFDKKKIIICVLLIYYYYWVIQNFTIHRKITIFLMHFWDTIERMFVSRT